MIKTPTVFILGAGASKPFGFPTGAELRQLLCTGLIEGNAIIRSLNQIGEGRSAIQQFRLSFQGSAVKSIDAFVAYQPKWKDIAEKAIAATLLPIENRSMLTTVGGRPGNSDWYGQLWGHLVEGAVIPEDLKNNKVKFITFNYDRSLDQFLLDAIACTFGIDYEKAFSILQDFPIKHVYGSLGHWIPNFGFGYGGLNDQQMLDRVHNASTSIKTVPSLRGTLDEEAAHWLSEATQICALGFGFDATNCQRIGLDAACRSMHGSQDRVRCIHSTSYELLPAEEAAYLANAFPSGIGTIQWLKGDSYTALRHLTRELS